MHLKRIFVLLFILSFTLLIFVGNILSTTEENLSEEGERTYTIKKGDTLWGLAGKFLNNPFLWKSIWSTNRNIQDPNLIEPGFKIIIPSLETKLLEEQPLTPAEGTTPLSPAEVVPVPLPPSVEAAPLPPSEGTAPLPPSEGTVPLPQAEGTFPLLMIEGTFPLLPTEGTFLIQAPVVKKALPVGMDKCRECHKDTSVQWDNTIHAKWKPSLLKPEKVKDVKKTDCETCHGPGSLHIDDPKNRMNIISFGAKSFNTRGEQNAVCLNCHEKGGVYYWKGNIHGRNLLCTDCHHVMENVTKRSLLNDTSERDICIRCHVQKKKDLLRSPHLSHDEAKMTCSTCHAPHGSDTPGILSAASVNENCFNCHADKRGPYLFDHLPVQENCLLCHVPHSSMNRALLKMRQPFLCLECHSNLPKKGDGMRDAHDVMNPGSRFTYNKGCTNCHPMIHGSRHPSGARLQR